MSYWCQSINLLHSVATRHRSLYEDRTRQASAYDRTPIERLTTHTMRLPLDSEHAENKLLPVHTSGL